MLLTLFSCTKKNSDTIVPSNNSADAMIYASQYFGPKTKVTPSQDGTLLLCEAYDKASLKFAVLDMNKKVILDTRKIIGSVAWHTNASLIVEELPGIIQDKSGEPEDYTRIIELNVAH